jgi:hypothetical protein
MFWPADCAGFVQCVAAQPGTPRPNWISEAPCACEAVIKGTTSLTPYGSVQILSCPATKPRVFRTWYTFDGPTDAVYGDALERR